MPPDGLNSYRPYTPSTQYNSDARALSRTPSPSPSEISALKQTSLFDFRAFIKRKDHFTRKRLIYYAIGIIVLVIVILIWVYDKQIVHAIQPAATWMHNLPVGWLIPIAIFFVISFPPLFGHEILAIVVGLVWGIGAGFGITAAGTFLGEVGNFYAFKYLFQGYADKKEKSNIQYACLSKLVREGGFKIALIVRYSAVPGHFTTAIFAVCGMNIFVFMAAAILSMPKQFITVYIGVLLEESSTGSTSTRDKILSYVVGAITVIVTIAAMWYIQRGVNRVKPDVIRNRRKARSSQAKLNASNGVYLNVAGATASDDAVFNPAASELALNPSDTPYDPFYQKWDRHGRAVEHASDSPVYAPQPRRASGTLDVGLTTVRAGSTTPTAGREHRESTDTVGWDLLATSQPNSYPLQSFGEPEHIGPLKNPFEIDEDAETVIPPISPPPEPPRRTSRGDVINLPQHNFGGAGTSARVKSPPA